MQVNAPLPDIRSLLPHSGAMVLLDRVVSADEDNLCAEVTIRSGALFCSDKGVGAWVGIEYMSQAIAAYAGYRARQRGEPIRLGFILGTRRYDCSSPLFRIGSVLRISAKRLFEGENGWASFDCEIVDVERGPAAKATLTVFRPANVEEVLRGSAT